MRTQRAVWMVGTALLLSGAITTVQAEDAGVKKAIQAEYDQISAALKRKDIKAIMKKGSPDFVAKGPNGQTMNAAQTEAMITQQFAMMKKVEKVSIKIAKLTLKEKRAVVIANTMMAAIVAGADGKPHKMVTVGPSKDTWVKTAQGWRIQGMEDLPGTKTTMDGKPFTVPTAPKEKP